jgi:hypothetical protein
MRRWRTVGRRWCRLPPRCCAPAGCAARWSTSSCRPSGSWASGRTLCTWSSTLLAGPTGPPRRTWPGGCGVSRGCLWSTGTPPSGRAARVRWPPARPPRPCPPPGMSMGVQAPAVGAGGGGVLVVVGVLLASGVWDGLLSHLRVWAGSTTLPL